MRLGFVIERKNYYRLFGPIIDRALARGVEGIAGTTSVSCVLGRRRSSFLTPTPFRISVTAGLV